MYSSSPSKSHLPMLGYELINTVLDWKLWIFPVFLATLLVVIAQYDFLAFHTLAEIFSIVISLILFATAWTTYSFAKSNYLIFLACGYLWIGSLDLVHTMSYKGMPFFVEAGANMPTQFWIVTRYFEAILLFLAPLVINIKLNKYFTIFIMGVVSVSLFFLIISGNFPTFFIEGSGLTKAKVINEYIIISILILALVTVIRNYKKIGIEKISFILLSIILTMFAELAFTFYVSVYGLSNLTGHIFKLFSFWLIYQAIVAENLKKPYIDLKKSVAVAQRQENIAEKALNDFKNQRNAIENHTMLSVTDLNGIITHVNEKFCTASKYSREELIGRDHRILNSSYHSKAFFLEIWDSISRGKFWNGDIKNRAKDGSIFWQTMTIAPLLNQQGDIESYISLRSDITELKNVEKHLFIAKEAAEEASKSKSQFLAHMSHELRTPLNAIIGFSQMMKEGFFGPLGDKRYTEYASDILASGKFLLDIVNDILDLTKIEEDKIEVDKEVMDVAEIVTSSAKILDPNAIEKNIKINISLPEEIPVIMGDKRHHKQILLNLISNAVKFTPGGGTVEVSVSIQNKKLCYKIKDNGIGIPADKINKVLEPFGQARADSVHTHEGLGLGLSLSKKLTELNGGTIALSSKVGVGTKVTVYFPL